MSDPWTAWDYVIGALYLLGGLLALGIACDFIHQWYRKLSGSYRRVNRRHRHVEIGFKACPPQEKP